MQCPYCQTENREDRETCYACGKDISTIRMVVNKARQHYNDALEHAERGRITEAIDELRNAVDLDAGLIHAHVVLGTLYARVGKFPEARESWQRALNLHPELARAHDYLERVDTVQAAMPTLTTYRRIALALLIATVALAAGVIYLARPDGGAVPLDKANQMLVNRQYGDALNELERAKIFADPGGAVRIAADALNHTLRLDVQQQVRMIQDLKYRQMYPETLAAIAELEAVLPDAETSAALATIRSDVSYYYHNLISQLYAAYEQGDVDFETLQDEIQWFVSLYPNSPVRDEISGYLQRAESMEVQASMDELRRLFALDNNVETAVEGLRDLAPRFGDMAIFASERSAFVEEILSYLFNMFTGYLDQQEFLEASSLLTEIDRVSTEFRDVVEIDISGAVDLAWSVLRDARRQYQLGQIEQFINQNDMSAAEQGLWSLLQETDISPAEMGLIRSYWRRINRREELANFYQTRSTDSRYFELQISDEEASTTLLLFNDVEDLQMPRRQRVHLLGLATASAMRLGEDDLVTSFTDKLRDLDRNSTVTRTVEKMIQDPVEDEPDTILDPQRRNIRIEPSRNAE